MNGLYFFLLGHQNNIILALQSICGIIVFLTLLTQNLSKRRKIAIFFLELSVILLLGSGRVFNIHKWDVRQSLWWISRVAKFGEYLSALLVIFWVNFYLKDLFKKEGGMQNCQTRLFVADIFLYMGLVMLIVSQFTNFYYYFDEANHYRRSYGRMVSNIFPVIALVLQASCMIRHFNKFSNAIRIPVILFVTVPILATVLQQKTQGLSLVDISSSIVAISIYVFAIQDMNHEIERAHKMEIEILERYKKELEETVQKRTYELRLANEKAERLLLNILPKDVAQELTDNPDKTISKKYPNATVLFTDIVGFTKMSGSMTAEETVTMLNKMTSLFDERSKREGVEKIKTIGDAYMAVTGLSDQEENDGAERMIRFAQGLLQDVQTFNETSSNQIQIRIGINSGNLVAGVIGKIKFIYDVWGDTVNVASRMEASGEPMRVHVSQSVYEQTKDNFLWQGPVQVDVKGKGLMNGYFLQA
ncbi:MAG: hypothetical protein IK015_09685 [Treponema sp.]|nr:hypothetical protein [Treponema sp.]